MAGEFDSLRVKIESNSDKARNNIGYLVTALSDLRKITGLTNDSLRETNGLLREMRDHFKSFKSMGDPFSGFSRGAERASRNAQKFRDAMAGTSGDTKASANAIVVWGNNSTTAIVKVTQALWDAKSAFDALKNATGRGSRFGGLLGDKDKDIIEGEYKERRAFNTSSPHFVWARSKNPTADQRNAWVTDSWRRRNATRGQEAEVEKAYEYFRERRAELSWTEKLQSLNPPTKEISKSAKDISTLKPIFDSVKKSALSLVKTLAKIPKAIGRGAIKTITAPFRAVGNAIGGATERAKRFFASIKRIAVYRLIRSALKAMTQAMREGIDNLYQWSLAVNTSFAPAMNSIATDLLYVKNALGAMISPLIEAFAPIMRGIADSLVSAFNWVQRVLSQLMGRDHWYKAIRVQTQYQEATNDTTKAVKKLRDEIHLMDWDEINNITENDDNGTGTSVANPVTPNPSEMFVQVEQPLELLEGNNFWERLGSLIGIGWGQLKEWWHKVDWADLGKKVGEKINEWVEKFNEWVSDIDWAEVGSKIGNVILDVWEFFKSWFDTVNWNKVFETIKTTLAGIWTALDTALRTIFPKYDKWRTEQEKAKDAKETVQEAYNHSINAEKSAEGFSNRSLNYLNLTDEEARDEAVKELASLNKDMGEISKNREELQKQLDNYFINPDGSVDTNRKEWYEEYYESVSRGEYKWAEEFKDAYLHDPNFKQYVNLRTEIEALDNRYGKLIDTRTEALNLIERLNNKETKTYNRVKTTAQDMASFAEYMSGTLLDLGFKDDIAGYAREVIESFTEADWADGGKTAMEKLRKALMSKGVSGALLEKAMEAAKAYANSKVWTNAGAKSLDTVANAVDKSGLIRTKWGKQAEDSLFEYLTSVNWGDGGVITSQGIVDALVRAGLSKEFAKEAGRDIFGYITGTYNGKGWHDIDQETVEVIKNSISEADIPYEYQTAAYDALMSYVSSVDWENGGTMTAQDIMSAFVGVGIPEDVARQAADSVVKWYTKFDPSGVGEKTARDMIATLQRYLSAGLGSLKIPTITVPIDYKLPKKMLQQNIEVNVVGSNKNLIQGYKGQIQAYFRANGGYVPQGSLFVAGEVPGQAEMVGNINGKTGVVSGREISGIGDAVWSTGNTTANILGQILTAIQNKNLTISPSAALGQTVAKSSRLYAMQTG